MHINSWICLADWANHRTCNTFASTKDQSTAKQELERYLHYFTRYQTHKKSEEFAKKQLKTTEDMMIQSDNKHPVMDIQFMIDVNKQLIDCRRVLKYSYVYGYYNMNLAATRNTTTIPFQKERFEQYQAVLEKFTESLSGLSEKPMENFDETIRADAVNQCRVVKKYIDNVLLHVEEGMDED
jgi:ariadne-1